MATQNPIEYEGTYLLPEAQLDRFALRMSVGYPKTLDDEIAILEARLRWAKDDPTVDMEPVINRITFLAMQDFVENSIFIHREILRYIAEIVRAARADGRVEAGPWKTAPVKTVCNGCSFACEMNIEVYDGMLVRASRAEGSWNGHLCDVCRFMRPWAEDLAGPLLNGEPVSWEEVKMFMVEREYALVLTPELTNEEIAFLREFAEKHGVPIGSTVSGGPSTATLEDIRKAKRVLLKADPGKCPLLKLLLKDKEIVEEDYEVAILEGPAEPLEVPTLILHGGVNAEGLIRAGLTGIPESKAYVVVGRPGVKLNGDVLVLPAGIWAEKSGTVTNSFGMELKLGKAREGYSPLELFS
ncbi:AAA family ATPase [Thermococcus stetteri]|uniref:AAA family ATPase n=1 Tax=Thermococcus stetteri TaxID=49900 RepID=UPI001AE75FB1|nr:hypothetical protein [Thermococcus stetteri]